MQFELVDNHALFALFHNRMIVFDRQSSSQQLASGKSFERCLLPQYAWLHLTNADTLSAAVLALLLTISLQLD